MMADFSFLDFVWRGLLVGTLTSTVVLLVVLTFTWSLQKKVSHLQMKWLFNNQLMLLLLVFAGSFLWVALGDPELATGCFDRFAQASSSLPITRILAGSWIMLAACFLGAEFLKVHSLARLTESFQPVQNAELSQRLSLLKRQLGVHRAIGLLTTEEALSPFVWGFFNHQVIISKIASENLSTKNLENILAHELIHVRDRDSLWILIARIGQRLIFFHPLSYWVTRLHLQLIEKAADEEAVKCAHVPAQDLLQSLLAVISLAQKPSPHPLTLHVSRSFRDLKSRMESLAQIENKPHSKNIFNGVVLGSVLLSLGISVAQAKLAVTGLDEKTPTVGLMCSQIKHEKLIEAWLNMESAPRSVPPANQTSLNRCQ